MRCSSPGVRSPGAGHAVVVEAIHLAGGSPNLAADGVDEQVALAGGEVAVGNPLDAFRRSDQAAYLDWLAGAPTGSAALTPSVRVVVVPRGTAAQRLMTRTARFAAAGGDARTVVY